MSYHLRGSIFLTHTVICQKLHASNLTFLRRYYYLLVDYGIKYCVVIDKKQADAISTCSKKTGGVS